MSNEVRYQYDDLREVARRFRELGDRGEAMIRRVMYCLRRMDDGIWIGRGSDEFREELEDVVLPALRRLAAVMGDAGWTLDRAADTMRDAEEMGARLFINEGRAPLNVNFSAVGITGATFGGLPGFTAGEIRRLGDIFGGFGGRGRDDMAAATVIDDDEMLGKRYGNNFFNRSRELLNNEPNPNVPPTLPGQNGPVVTPPWFTEHSTEDGGLNGAADAAVVVAGAGDHERLTGDIAKTSQALGGAQVSGVFATEEGPLRGPGAVAVANTSGITTVSPAAQALMEWVRKHPNGLFVLPPWSAAYGAEALHALEAEGFDLSRLNVVTFAGSTPDFPDSITHHRTIQGFPDLRV